MNPKITELVTRIRTLQGELEAELEARRAELNYHLENHRVRFEREVLARHRQLRMGLLRYLASAPLRHYLSAPIIYGMAPVLVLLDLAVSLYQWTCFPLYRIARVRRRDYFAFDREHLAYLNAIEKINCAYCAYGNGLVAYVREVVARTEQYWCPIKHARRLPGEHERYADFADFGDADAYPAELERLRRALRSARKEDGDA